MKYKDFKAWCNNRACDGCWSKATAVYCIKIMQEIDEQPFWRREKAWLDVKEFIEKEIVSVINKKISEVQNG